MHLSWCEAYKLNNQSSFIGYLRRGKDNATKEEEEADKDNATKEEEEEKEEDKDNATKEEQCFAPFLLIHCSPSTSFYMALIIKCKCKSNIEERTEHFDSNINY